jgi:hypothetical protein
MNKVVVLRDNCPFFVFINPKPQKYVIKVRVAADAKNFYASNMQVYTGKTVEAREKKLGLQVVKGFVTHMEPEVVLLLMNSLQVVN